MNYHELEKDRSLASLFDHWDKTIDPKIRVAICIPTYDFRVHLPMMISLFHMWKPVHYFIWAHGPTIDVNRNRLVNEGMMHEETTHLLFVDSDMVFPHNMLSRFLQHDKDIMSGIYYQKNIPFRSTQFRSWQGESFQTLRVADYKEGELVEIESGGAGALLVKKSVFETLDSPMFKFTMSNHGLKYLGEDIYFFKKARKQGFKSYVDTSIICNHMNGSLMFPKLFEDGFLEVGENSKTYVKSEKAFKDVRDICVM